MSQAKEQQVQRHGGPRDAAKEQVTVFLEPKAQWEEWRNEARQVGRNQVTESL